MRAPLDRRPRSVPFATIGGAVAGGMAVLASFGTWVQVTVLRPAGRPASGDSLTGLEAVPLVPVAGAVVLAASLALVVLRGAGRLAAGVLVVLAGAVLVWSGIEALAAGTSPDPGVLEDLLVPGDTGVRTAESVLWPVLTILAGLLALVSGGTAMRHGPRGVGLVAGR